MLLIDMPKAQKRNLEQIDNRLYQKAIGMLCFNIVIILWQKLYIFYG